MRKSLITMILLSFIAYAFVKHQKKIDFQTKIEDTPTYQFVKEAASYVETLSADPPHINKDDPILKDDDSAEVNKASPPSPATKGKKITNVLGNVFYNILHTPKGQELLEKVLSNQYYNYNDKRINPYSNNSAVEVLQGDGIAAECGDIVQAHYILRLVNGQIIENTINSNQPKTFRIGDHQVIRGLEYAVMGMKVGGRKRIVVPPKNAYKKGKFSKGLIAGNEFVTIDVELRDIKPLFPDWQK
jgi:peptidylprolyl isomerase